MKSKNERPACQMCYDDGVKAGIPLGEKRLARELRKFFKSNGYKLPEFNLWISNRMKNKK